MSIAATQERTLDGLVRQASALPDKHEEELVETEPTAEKGREAPRVDHFGAAVEHSAEERRLVRKLDLYMMPLLFIMFYLNKTDQNAIANAKLGTLSKDLGLQGVDFNVCVSILYVGYSLVQVPSNILMSTGKVRPSTWMACWMGVWGVISATTGAVTNYGGLFASLFYTRREIATRISIIYSANNFASSFSGLITAAIFSTMNGRYGIAGWRWLFIILDVVTVVMAVVALFILPDLPQTTRWLSAEERAMAIERVERDTVGLSASAGPLEGFKQAVKDAKLWVFILIQLLHLCSFGFVSFFPTVVATLGFNTTLTLVLTTPPYLLSGAFSVGLAYSSGRFNERTWHITLGSLVAIAGFSLAASTLNTAARYTACFLFAAGAYSGNSIIVGWVAATCGQTPEKKAAALSMVNMISMTSFIWTPYLYPASDGPRYLSAMIANAAFSAGVLVLSWVMRFWLQLENRKLKNADGGATLLWAY